MFIVASAFATSGAVSTVSAIRPISAKNGITGIGTIRWDGTCLVEFWCSGITGIGREDQPVAATGLAVHSRLCCLFA